MERKINTIPTSPYIQRLSVANLPSVMLLIQAAISEMERNGIYQWDEIYPDEEKIRTDLLEETLYGWIEDEMLCAIIVLNELQSPLYAGIQWQYIEGIPLIIHRLCVHPNFQRKGIAKKLVSFAEQFALQNTYPSIRLDAFAENPAALLLYRNLNYEERGTVKARKGLFHCFEKNIRQP